MKEREMLFLQSIEDIIDHPSIRQMSHFTQHVSSVTCLEHSLFVSYMSFRICQFLKWDSRAAARGGLLHDLFLYDSRVKESHEGVHGFSHPKTALKNAEKVCELSQKEKDIIVKHMWPLTISFPRYKESYAVTIADKICATIEFCHAYHLMRTTKKLAIYA